MGERSLSLFQWGIESTRGTAVAATRKVGFDPKGIPMDRVWEGVRLATAQRVPRMKKRNDTYLVQDTLVASHGYYQLLPGILQCMLDGTITPAEQTPSQADYKWDVTPSITAANDPDSLTLEMGDNVQMFEVEYCQFNRLVLAGSLNQQGASSPVRLEAGYYGRQMTPTTVTASQALHTGVEFMNAKLSRLYQDTTWGGVGGTEVTSTLRDFNLELLAGNHPKFLASANKYFDTHGEGDVGAMLTLTLEGNSSADSIYDLYQAGTERALRITLNGSQIGSGVNYKFQLDVYGYWAEVVPLDSESNGNNLHKALFVSQPDSSGNYLDIDVITNHNAI
jgi:hypothetical protein